MAAKNSSSSSSNAARTKAERREAARAQAEALRKAQEARDKRNRTLAIIFATVGVLVLVGLGWWIVQSNSKSGENTGSGFTASAKPMSEVTAPKTANKDGGFPMGKSGDAGTTNPNAVTVDIYQDYMCPRCGEFEQSNKANLDSMRESGQITQVLHPVSILDSQSSGTMYSTRAAAAVAYVAQEDPAIMAKFNEALYANQPEEGSKGLTNEKIASIAKSVGATSEVQAKISDGTAYKTFGDWVLSQSQVDAKNKALFSSYSDGTKGFGTPTIVINGKKWNGNWTDPNALKQAVASAQKG